MTNLSLLCRVVVNYLMIISCYGVNLNHIKNVDNLKQYKKILKTHTNVLTIYSKNEKSVLSMLKFAETVAKEIRGLGTIVYINCGKDKESKKLCKKYNVNPMPRSMKHYKDGRFHKDFDRKDNAKSLHTFMLDPSGDAPWEEDPNSKDVLHINSEKEFTRTQRNKKGPMLVMFYAPWCGHCKKLKPDYSAAATELKGKAILAGMDVDKPDAHNVRYRFNITGYPTLIYFENGEQKFTYGGKMNKAGLVEWMTNPQPVEEKKSEDEESWSAPEILHLTDATFDEALTQHESMVVMFYAPWCGHCKSMKPEYVEAAIEMKEKEIAGTLAAVDCTKEQKSCKQYDVTGYPTVKYFRSGEYKFKLSLRKKDKIVEFMISPEEPPPPPPEDLPWKDVSGPEILHLDEHSFKDILKKKKHVLVMFYAPWCGHCKKAKPEMQEAAKHYEGDRKVFFAGLDCTTNRKVCEQFNVGGYPTFRYFLYGKNDFGYNGGRTADAFIKFMKDPSESSSKSQGSDEEEWKDEPSSVVHLEDDSFTDFVNANPSVLVMFYAPWCGHCKAMKPAYTEAASEMLDTQHVLAAVDCTKHRKVASKYDIKGYPTIKFFSNGIDTEYEGGRSKQDLVKFFKSNEKSSQNNVPLPVWEGDTEDSVVHLDDSSFESYIKDNDQVFVMFYAPWCGHCKNMKPAYIQVAKDANINQKVTGQVAAVDCTTNPQVAKKYGVKGYPSLKFFQDGKEFTAYKGERTKEAILQFMTNPVVAPTEPPPVDWSVEDKHVEHLTDLTFRDFIVANPSVLVMFYAPWCGHCKTMKPEFSAAAQIINTENQLPGKLAAVDCTKNPSITKRYAISGYPTLKYFKNSEDYLKYGKARKADAIVEFMKNPVAAPTKPPPPEWKDDPSHIYHLDDTSFDLFIKEHDALVMFYAPWCGHCNAMKPAYKEAAQALHESNANGVLAAVDSTKSKDLSKKHGVSGYPTLNYYRNGVLLEVYEKSRSVENLVKFIKTKDEMKSAESDDVGIPKFEELPSSVVHLNAGDMDDHLKKHSAVLVMFHILDCELCKEVRKDYMRAASRLAFSEQISFAALSCDHDKVLCDEFPVIQLFNKGKYVENYKGEYLADNFVRYVVQYQQKTEL